MLFHGSSYQTPLILLAFHPLIHVSLFLLLEVPIQQSSIWLSFFSENDPPGRKSLIGKIFIFCLFLRRTSNYPGLFYHGSLCNVILAFGANASLNCLPKGFLDLNPGWVVSYIVHGTLAGYLRITRLTQFFFVHSYGRKLNKYSRGHLKCVIT